MALPRYQHVISVMLHDQPTSPFKVRGAEVTQLFEPWHNPGGLARLEAAVNTNLDRRPMREILADQASLDERIAEFLAVAALRRRGGSASPTATASRASGAAGSELAPADGADLAPVIALRPDGGSARHAAQDAAPGSDLD